ELVRDHVRQGGLAEPGRTEDQHVVERLAAALRGFDVDAELLAHDRLAEVLGEPLRADRRLDEIVFAAGAGGAEAVGHRLKAGARVRRDGRDYGGFRPRGG